MGSGLGFAKQVMDWMGRGVHPEYQVGYITAGRSGLPNALYAIQAPGILPPCCRSKSPSEYVSYSSVILAIVCW